MPSLDIPAIRDAVYAAYVANFPDFQLGTKFHMASRLFLWSQDQAPGAWLTDMQQEWTIGEHASTLELLRYMSKKKPTGERPRNSLQLRRPFLEKYPMLGFSNPVLSKIHFLATIYGQDFSNYFFQLFPEQKIRQLARDLIQDEQALMVLSTYAINFLYFLRYDILHEDIPADTLLDIATRHTPESDPDLIQLSIYFYTHCILGESRFYYRTIQQNKLPMYQQMLAECEKLIVKNFDYVHLDNKLEFLVCTRILRTSSSLEERIYAEVAGSLSSEGSFLVDQVNKFPQIHRTTLETSEHRNVLFLLSLSNYSPIDQ